MATARLWRPPSTPAAFVSGQAGRGRRRNRLAGFLPELVGTLGGVRWLPLWPPAPRPLASRPSRCQRQLGRVARARDHLQSPEVASTPSSTRSTNPTIISAGACSAARNYAGAISLAPSTLCSPARALLCARPRPRWSPTLRPGAMSAWWTQAVPTSRRNRAGTPFGQTVPLSVPGSQPFRSR